MKHHGKVALSCKQIPLIFLLCASPLMAEEPASMAKGISSESISNLHDDVSVPVTEYCEVFETLATTNNAIDWQYLLRPVFPLSDSDFDGAIAIIDSLQSTYDIVPNLLNCERWPAWQLGLCNLELAAGRYSDAVDRHVSLFRDTTSCIDDQAHWWVLPMNHYLVLRLRNEYLQITRLLEEIEKTFPSGPARQIRAELARLKYRLGTLEWSEATRGTLGEARMGGIASHYRDLITTGGDTLTCLVSNETIIIRNEEIWVRGIGFTPRLDFESEYNGGDPFSASAPVDSGKPAVFYLDNDGEVIMIELFEVASGSSATEND